MTSLQATAKKNGDKVKRTLSKKTQVTLVSFFRNLAELELSVEQARVELADLYDFEPFAAFNRVDGDKNKKIYTMDIYEFLQENNRNRYSIKDVQLMMQFYDLDNSGSLGYTEFMKFILPCDN